MTEQVRPSWDAYFVGIAVAVSKRADCLRAQHGAVIVDKDHRVIATGYNGVPPGDPRSCTAGDCPRGLKTAEEVAHSTGDYVDCISCHAEQNAIANSTRDTSGGTIFVTGTPCPMCNKLILAAGLKVVYDTERP